MNFEVKTDKVDDSTYVISLAGEVDLYTAPEFKQQLLDVIGEGGKDVVVDFSDTTFIDSTTLGVLVGGVKRLRGQEGRLSLVCSDRNITKIFEITGSTASSRSTPPATRRSRRRAHPLRRCGARRGLPRSADRRSRLRLRHRGPAEGGTRPKAGSCS